MSERTAEDIKELTDDSIDFMHAILRASTETSLTVAFSGSIGAACIIHQTCGETRTKEKFLEIVSAGYDAIERDMASGKKKLQ